MITRAEWDSYSDEDKWTYARTMDYLLEQEDKVLKLIPECPKHGFCLSHYSDWIKAQQVPILNMESVRKNAKRP